MKNKLLHSDDLSETFFFYYFGESFLQLIDSLSNTYYMLHSIIYCEAGFSGYLNNVSQERVTFPKMNIVEHTLITGAEFKLQRKVNRGRFNAQPVCWTIELDLQRTHIPFEFVLLGCAQCFERNLYQIPVLII